MIPRRRVKIKFFLSVVIYVVKSRFCAAFGNPGKSRKRRCRKALRRFALPYPGYNHGTPKPGAIPTSLYPDIQFLPLYQGGGENQRFFCLWSFMWSKPLCADFSNRDKSRKRRASFTKPYYYTACSARLQGLFVVCGPFFRIFGANALHGLVLLTSSHRVAFSAPRRFSPLRPP